MYAIKTGHKGHVVVRENIGNKGHELSMSFDDSCGALQAMSRSSLCVYFNGDDITESIFPGAGNQVEASAKNVAFVYMWVQANG